MLRHLFFIFLLKIDTETISVMLYRPDMIRHALPSRQFIRTCLTSVSMGALGMSQYRSTFAFAYPYTSDSHILSEQKAHDLSAYVVPTLNVSSILFILSVINYL